MSTTLENAVLLTLILYHQFYSLKIPSPLRQRNVHNYAYLINWPSAN